MSVFYLRSLTVVEPLVPGRPSSCFPPLPRTGLQPFLSFFFYSASPCSFVFGGNGVKTQAGTAPTWSPASPLCLETTTPWEKFKPSTFRHSASLRIFKRPRSVSDGCSSLMVHVEFFKRGQVPSPPFPRVPCWPRDRQRRRTSSGCVTSPTGITSRAKYERNSRISNS